MICARCSKPIRPGEPSDEFTQTAPTGGGATVPLHKLGTPDCVRPPTQTAPERIPRP